MPCAPKRSRPVRVAELGTPRFGGRQGCLRAGGDRLTLLLSHQSEDSDCQMTCLRHVRRLKLHPAILQLEQESGVATKAVQLRDYESRAGYLRMMKRLGELGPVIASPALDFGVFPQDLTFAAAAEQIDTIPLSLEPKARSALGGSGHSKIGDSFHRWSFLTKPPNERYANL
jgi:hypothetical protein